MCNRRIKNFLTDEFTNQSQLIDLPPGCFRASDVMVTAAIESSQKFCPHGNILSDRQFKNPNLEKTKNKIQLLISVNKATEIAHPNLEKYLSSKDWSISFLMNLYVFIQ